MSFRRKKEAAKVFHAQRWASVFLSVSGKDANEAFLCLSAFCAQIKNVHGVFFGHSASVKLEKILRESAASANEETPAVEYAIRFLCLLVEKNCFRNIGLVLQKIEQDLDVQNGILDVTVESTATMDSGFEEELSKIIKKKTGAAGIKMKTLVKPQLLGGYLLRIGSHYVDASLKGQLESMAAHLGENTGGRNG
ncbi:MAG: F0F1 ATP synthase subunit delta [Treponema sp.]|jgi:ATP synthase F1 delta subunit|nr:F0F1 ATP synthase subunit delta [Treponema sp.]